MTTKQAAHTTRIASAEQAAARYRTPARERYDLVILGGGAGGLTAASIAVALHAKVALIDRERLGGECLNTGCVPSKALLHVARVAWSARRASQVGLSARLDPVDFAQVAGYVQAAIDAVYVESDAPEHFIAQGVDVIFGEARFTSPASLAINGKTITARRFLIATGSSPAIPNTPGLREAGYLTNETAFAARALPQRLLVIGGGPIGCELGQAFARLGSAVTIVQRSARLIPREEPQASGLLRAQLEAEGVRVLTEAEVARVERSGAEYAVTAHVGSAQQTFTCDALLVAVGRAPNVDGLGLEAAGVRYDTRNGIAVDSYLATSSPRIYALGDVAGGLLFAHAAAAQAKIATRNALIPIRKRLDERVTPWATFTEPEVGRVGLTEAQARQAHGDAIWTTTLSMASVDRAATESATQGFIKLVATAGGRLLGATVVGEAAGEVINEVALAMTHGLTLAQLAATTHVYPTIALGLQQAAGQYTLRQTSQSGLVRLLRTLAR